MADQLGKLIRYHFQLHPCRLDENGLFQHPQNTRSGSAVVLDRASVAASCGSCSARYAVRRWAQYFKMSSLAIKRRTNRSASLKSCLRPRGTRLENACAKCKRMWGSSSSHTDRHYWAVDSITASSTPCSRNHVSRRCNSLGMVTNRRHAGFSSFHVNVWAAGPSQLKTRSLFRFEVEDDSYLTWDRMSIQFHGLVE